MDKRELAGLCVRVLEGRGDGRSVELIALALQRYLVGEARAAKGDRRVYQRDYMREYRAGKRRRKHR